MLGYVGPPVPLAELVTRPRHSLLIQSYQPKEMTSGTVNADGYGAALWLDDDRPEPAIYRTAAPIWADPNLGWMGDRLRVRAALAAVRSATPGIGYELSNVQPFARGRVSLVHNGYVEKFRHGPQRAIRQGLQTAAYESIAGTSDSEHLFALVLDQLDREVGPPSPKDLPPPLPQGALERAIRAALGRLGRICREERVACVAALIVSDGETLLAARWSHGVPSATLYAAAFPQDVQAGTRQPGSPDLAFCVASEPLEPTASPSGGGRSHWQAIAPQRLLVLAPGRPPRTEPLE